MLPLSDRQHDAFDNPAKTACREGNLRVLREAAYLLWEDGNRTRLRCDWCELMGATGERTIDLLEREGVLAPGGFVGVDLDPARIDGFRRRRSDLKWVAGNLYERLETPELANVGVLNLDAYGEVGDADGLGDFHLIRGLALRGLERFGEFALFWNQDLDSVARRGAAAARRCAATPKWFAGRSRAVCRAASWRPRCYCLKAGEEMVESGFVGVLGAFEVYRGKKSGHRMANLRLILR